MDEEQDINHKSISSSWNQRNNERKVGFLYACIVFALGISLSVYGSGHKKDEERTVTMVYFSILYTSCITILIVMLVYLHKNRHSTYEDLQQGKVLAKVQYSLGGEKLNLYLRLGVTLFGSTSAAVMVLKIIITFKSEEKFEKYLSVIHFLLEMIFLIFQSVFLVRYHRVVFFQYKKVIGFCLLHLITTNLCIWSDKAVSKVSKGLSVSHKNDTKPDMLNKIIDYLLPTITEYAVLAAAILFELSTRVGQKSSVELHCNEELNNKGFWNRMCGAKLGMLCACLLFITAAVLSILVLHEKNTETFTRLLYPTKTKDEISSESIFIINLSHSIELSTVLCITVVISILTYIHTRPLKFTVTYCKHSLDESLLYISFFFTANYLLCSLVVAFNKGATSGSCQKFRSLQILRGVMGIVELIQVIFQTYLIQDTLYRCCSTEKHKKEKPGRNSLAAMLAANFVLWLIASLQTKEADIVYKEESDLCLGVPVKSENNNVLRDLFLYATLPLLMLYRYHSTVCLSEIFSKIYQDEISRFTDYWRTEGAHSDQNGGGGGNRLAIITQNSVNNHNNQRNGNASSPRLDPSFETGITRARACSIAVIPFPSSNLEIPQSSHERISKRRPTIRLMETARYHAQSYELSHKLLNRKIVPISSPRQNPKQHKNKKTKLRDDIERANECDSPNQTPTGDKPFFTTDTSLNNVAIVPASKLSDTSPHMDSNNSDLHPALREENGSCSNEFNIPEMKRICSTKRPNKSPTFPVIQEELEDATDPSDSASNKSSQKEETAGIPSTAVLPLSANKEEVSH